MWLPTPLYEALPYLYGILALVTASMFGSIGFVSAALFATAGWLVWRMRRTYRREDDDTLHVV